MDSNEKWLQYKPNFEVNNFLEAIGVIENDKYGCFIG